MGQSTLTFSMVLVAGVALASQHFAVKRENREKTITVLTGGLIGTMALIAWSSQPV